MTLGVDRRTITLDLQTSSSADQLRIITIADGATEPRITANSVEIRTPPLSTEPGKLESITSFVLIPEGELTSSAPIDVDISTTGNYNKSQTTLSPSTVPANTKLRSYLLHFDPLGTSLKALTGTVTFQGQILGLILSDATLQASDGLFSGNGVTYPASTTSRETDIAANQNDAITWSDDLRSLRFRLEASTAIDQLRVLVAE